MGDLGGTGDVIEVILDVLGVGDLELRLLSSVGVYSGLVLFMADLVGIGVGVGVKGRVSVLVDEPYLSLKDTKKIF